MAYIIRTVIFLFSLVLIGACARIGILGPPGRTGIARGRLIYLVEFFQQRLRPGNGYSRAG